MKHTLLLVSACLLTVSCVGPNSIGPHRQVRAGEGTGSVSPLSAKHLMIGTERAVPSPRSQGQRQPAIAYGDGVYLLVWREGFNGYQGQSDILAMRIAQDGTLLDREPIPVCAEPGVQDMPAVAYGGGEFIVAWTAKAVYADEKNRTALHTRRVGKDGILAPQKRSLFSDSKMTRPAIAANGKDEFLLVWQHYEGPHYVVRGTRIAFESGALLDNPHLDIMVGSESLGLSWALGGPLSLVWTGTGYVVAQAAYAVYLDAHGKILLPITRTWRTHSGGGGEVVAALGGHAVLFHNTRPFPDPWGWGGNSVVAGMTVTPQNAQIERNAFAKLIPEKDKNHEFRMLADGVAANVVDASRWLNHPGWPMGMPGGLKQTHRNVWPSGPPAAAYNGESLIVVWPRGYLADNRRVVNRDLYLTRVLPGWTKKDTPPVPVAAGDTEHNHPVLCAGPRGQALLAYEKLTDQGVAVRYRLLEEQADTTAPRVEYVVPKSRTETVVVFDKPLDPATAGDVQRYQIDGLDVVAAELSPDARSNGRDVVLTTTTPPTVGRRYTLRYDGIADRTPTGNIARHGVFQFRAKPGLMQRADRIYQWDNDNASEYSYLNPDRVGWRDFICTWSLLGPLPRDIGRHPFDPAVVLPSPGDAIETTVGPLVWKAAEGEVLDLGVRLGKQSEQMAYVATYVFSDRRRPAVLRLDSNDHNRAWWNGIPTHDGIGAGSRWRGFHNYTDEIPILLRAGWNRLLVQVDNYEGHWMMVGQISDARGEPIRDLTWQRERPVDLD